MIFRVDGSTAGGRSHSIAASFNKHAPGLSYHLAFPPKTMSRACACQEVGSGNNGGSRQIPDTGAASVKKHLGASYLNNKKGTINFVFIDL